ncbi:MAG: hypothetical protein AAGJ84_02940 [Pseudomonadota bacterium]
MRILFFASSLLALTACASGTSDPLPAVTVPTPPITETGNVDTVALAMGSVESLVEAGNEQAAIDRLTQLLGQPDLSTEDKTAALQKRAEIRFDVGNDVEGAVSDFDELMMLLRAQGKSVEPMPMAVEARLEASSLLEALAQADLEPGNEFEILFRLGRHQDAADLMLSRNLTPDRAYLLDMYQIGYLCDDAMLSGPNYDVTDLDGTPMTLRFCDFGK